MVLKALLHHIRRTAIHSGAGWSADCSAECEDELRSLEQRLVRLEEEHKRVLKELQDLRLENLRRES